jgi:hypothetical protein
MDDRSDERREHGPLGNEEETRGASSGDEEENRNQEEGEPRGQEEGETRRLFRRPRRRRKEETQVYESDSGESGTRVIQTSGREGRASSSGYYEALEERYERLRELHGGVDWLAGFIGFVFTAVVGTGLFAVASLVLMPLGLSFSFEEITLDSAVITGLVLAGVVLFLSYLIGGYVSGRIARFDGGINGIMVVVWTIVVSVLAGVVGVVFGTVLSGDFFAALGNGVSVVLNAAGAASANLGYTALGIVVVALIIALLGGFLGGRMGARYHREIDLLT